MIVVVAILAYFMVLWLWSRAARNGKVGSGNEAFFRGGRQSPWWMVAFGMVGASISGVTFVSVPGMVMGSGMTYLQTCMGFIVGYFVVAFVLLPIYYRLNLTTIYTFLERRLGWWSYKTGAAFFILSKTVGAAVRFYVVCIILQRFVLDAVGVPFSLTVVGLVALIWMYTSGGGIRTLVWTDTFQTVCMFGALVLITLGVARELGMGPIEAVEAIRGNEMSRVFEWSDWRGREFFWKQFVSGAFIVVVMTGLDQDMMQKNLTCRSLRDAQKDMCTYGFAFVPANLLFLSLGVLLVMLAERDGTMGMVAQSDYLLPLFAATGRLGEVVTVLFSVGIVAASFSSADSALTALTTSCCVDIFGRADDERLRRWTHGLLCVAFAVVIISFGAVNSTSAIDAIYILCSYTYGPLLGLFAFALVEMRRGSAGLIRHYDGWGVPLVCVASPAACYGLDWLARTSWGYGFGYELLIVNGGLVFMALYIMKNGRLLHSSPPPQTSNNQKKK